MTRKYLVWMAMASMVLVLVSAAAAQDAGQNPAGDLNVTAIEVTGNKSISTNTIVSKLKTQVGSPYRENIINDDLKRLYGLNFFSDIKIDTQRSEGGLKVIIAVKERPIIEKIVLSGSRRAISDQKLKESLKSKEGQYLDHPILAEDAATIKALYEKKGYSKVDVQQHLETDEAANKAVITFAINEGTRQRVRVIYVEGNIHFSDSRILKVIKTKRAWLFNPGVFKEEVLVEDMTRIKEFYANNGFIDASAAYEITTDPRSRFLYITIKVEEGKKYLVGTLTVEGNRDLSQGQILGKIKQCVPGKVFSPEALKQDIVEVQGLYFDHGYIAAQVQQTTTLNSFTGRIDITLTVIENQIYYVDRVKIRGNVKTRDLVVRREMRIKPGDRFDGEKLRRSKERLQNLGFFEEISYDTEDTDQPQHKDLVVDVRETKTGVFSFGGGYSSIDQLVGFVEIEQRNFDWKNWPNFTGAGQNLKLRASTGSITQGLELSFTEPWLFDYPVSFGFDAYVTSHDRDEDSGYGYSQKITGGDLRLGKELSEYVRGTTMYKYETVKIWDIEEDASSALKQEEGTNSTSSMEFGLTYDHLDNTFSPTRGTFFSNSLQVAGGPFAGDFDFWKYYGKASQYFPLPRGSSLAFTGRAGYADMYGDSTWIPIYEKFFAGGASTIRGYDERSVGPYDSSSDDPLGGQSMLIGNIEYTYPLASFLKVAVFYDIGNVWAEPEDIGSGGFCAGYGLGVRLKTPIGPLLLDYGIPLDEQPDEQEKGSGQFYFSMRQTF